MSSICVCVWVNIWWLLICAYIYIYMFIVMLVTIAIVRIIMYYCLYAYVYIYMYIYSVCQKNNSLDWCYSEWQASLGETWSCQANRSLVVFPKKCGAPSHPSQDGHAYSWEYHGIHHSFDIARPSYPISQQTWSASHLDHPRPPNQAANTSEFPRCLPEGVELGAAYPRIQQ